MKSSPLPAPTVALCIPTYNRASCLETLLASAVAQVPPFDEIVISDDASSDATPSVISRFAAKLPYLRHHRCDPNVGLDVNFRTVVELATTDFIWFMGDDDRLRGGAVATVKAMLQNQPDALGATVGVVDYDNRLDQITGMRRRVATHTYNGAGNVFTGLADLLGFMSSMIVRRDAWQSAMVGADIGVHDNLYSQVYRVGRMLGKAGAWLAINDLLVDFRSDNDQFRLKLGGHMPRLRRDVDSYSAIFDDLFANDHEARLKADHLILTSHVISRVRNAKMEDPRFPVSEAYKLLRQRYGADAFFWRNVVPTLIAPSGLLKIARAAYQTLSPSSGVARARRL